MVNYMVRLLVFVALLGLLVSASKPCKKFVLQPNRYMKCLLRQNEDGDLTNELFGGYHLEDDDDEDRSNAAKINQAEFWDRYRSEMINLLTQGNPDSAPYLQVLPVPQDADWDESGNEHKLQRICDAVPFSSGFYETTSYKISTQYKEFINNLDVAKKVLNAAAKSKLDQLQADFAKLQKEIKDERFKCWLSYETSGSNLSIERYEKTKCNGLAAKEEALQDMNFLTIFYTKQAYGNGAVDVQESKFETNAGQDFAELFPSNSLANFRAAIKKNQKNRLSVSISKHTRVDKKGQYGNFKDGIQRSSSLSNSFFNLLTADGAKGDTAAIDVFKMDLQFESYKKIEVGPGTWFNYDVLRQYYQSGPFIRARKNLFGKDGTMTLIPKSIYVVYKPTMKLTVSHTDKFDFKKALSKSSGSGGLFGSKKSESATVETKFVSSDEEVVTIKSNSDTPVIIAMDFDHLL